MSVTVIRDRRFQDHQTGAQHPERPQRLEAIERALASMTFHELPARPATREELLRVHTEEHLVRLDEVRGKNERLDADTVASPFSVDAAYLAAGATVDLALAVARGEAEPGMALVRPPGHHATREKAMGFCLLNNAAVAARALRAAGLAERIAIYDFDVHHGNGTEDIFYDDPHVLYLSTHQWPQYPGTGKREDVGVGAGEGATLNVPLPAGTDSATLIQVTRDVLAPKLADFAPDFVLLSAGFDPYFEDPLGGFKVTVEGFRELTLLWRELAEKHCGGRVAAVLEGGYHLEGLAQSVRAVLDGWR